MTAFSTARSKFVKSAEGRIAYCAAVHRDGISGPPMIRMDHLCLPRRISGLRLGAESGASRAPPAGRFALRRPHTSRDLIWLLAGKKQVFHLEAVSMRRTSAERDVLLHVLATAQVVRTDFRGRRRLKRSAVSWDATHI
jgi:hypothetical protein